MSVEPPAFPGFETEGVRYELRELARHVAARELAPNAARWDEEGTFPDTSFKALAAADLLGLTVPEAYRGSGLGDVEAAIVLEELARADVSSAILAQLCLNGPPRVIGHLGSDALKERWLPPVARGEIFMSIGITEPDAGSSAASMRAQLVADGDGYRLNGYKNYSTGGHRAAGILVWCRFPGSERGNGPGGGAEGDHRHRSEGGGGPEGIGAVVVDTSADGVEVVSTHHNMGLHGLTEAELAFDGARIEADDVLIASDRDDSRPFWALVGHLNHERCGNAAMCLGAAQGALERAVRYLNERETGGRRLASLQGLQWKIADMAVALEGARLLVYKAVGLSESCGGTPPPMETAMAKTAANLAAKQVCDEAMQLLGGYGYSREEPVERAFRDVRGLCIGGGTVEVLRNYVGQGVLKGRLPYGPAWLPAQSGETR